MSLKIRFQNHWKDRFRSSPIAKALKLFGQKAFTIKVLRGFSSKEKAYKYESKKVKFLKTYHPYGMNATMSGQNSEWTELTRRKLSEVNRGQNHPMYGKQHSLETKLRWSESRKGTGNPFYGKEHSPETKKRISESRKGILNPMYGRSPGNQKGETNPNAKITESRVKEIKSYLWQGCKVCDVVAFTGLSRAIVQPIKTGKTWGHVEVR